MMSRRAVIPSRLVVEEIDLVDRDDDRAFLLVQRSDKRGEILFHVLGLAHIQIAVKHQQHAVCGVKALPGRLGHDPPEMPPRLSAQGMDAGGVHKDDLGVPFRKDAHDAVAGGLWSGSDNGHLSPDQRIDER